MCHARSEALVQGDTIGKRTLLGNSRHSKGEAAGAWGEGMGAGGGMGGTANSQMDEGPGLKLTCGRLQCEKMPLEACK